MDGAALKCGEGWTELTRPGLATVRRRRATLTGTNTSVGQKKVLTWQGTGAPLCFQIALTCTQIWWTTEVGLAFARLEEGYENAIKDYNKKQVCPAHPMSVLSTLLCEVLACAPAISLSQKQPNIGNSCSAQE